MPFYATCPHCKLPNLVEEDARDLTFPCAACGKPFRPLRQTAQPTWTSPPVRPDPPPPLPDAPRPAHGGAHVDVWADNYLLKRRREKLLPGQQPGRTAEGLLTLIVLMELFHAGVGCLIWYTTQWGRKEADVPRFDVSEASVGCYCILWLFNIVAAVFFLVWFGHTYSNLPDLGVYDARFNPAWAVVCFFIPGVNLILPHMIMQELWKASDPSEAEHHWSEVAGSRQISCWWAFWLMSTLSYAGIIFIPVVLVRHPGFHLFAQLTQFYFVLNILAPLFTMVAGFLLIGLIEEIIQRQTKKYLKQWSLPAER